MQKAEMLRHGLGFLSVLGLFVSPVSAQLNVGSDVQWHSRYEWRGLTVRDGMVLQPDFWVSGGEQFALTFGAWSNIELTTPDTTEFGYGRSFFGESNVWAEFAAAFEAADLAVGWNWYHFNAQRPGRVPVGAFTTHELYARLQLLNLPVIVPRLEYFHDVDKAKGGFLHASMMIRVPLWTQVRAPIGSILLTGSTGYNVSQDSIAGVERFRDAGFKYAEFSIATVTGYLPVPTIDIAFNVGFHLQFNLDDTTKNTILGTPRNRETWWTFGLQLAGPRCNPTKRICS